MVASSSAAAQAAENEKRKKQTMEKVKVNHLSRQLQMRLQYARLKVEHGWQKQNLNEVENLYFHNSHLRGSKSYPVPTIITAQSQPPTFAPPQLSFAQSRLSFRFDPTPNRNYKATGPTPGSEQNNYVPQGETNPDHASQAETPADNSTFTTSTDPSSGPNAVNSNSPSTHLNFTQSTSSLSISTASLPLVPSDSNENISRTTDDNTVVARDSTISPQDDQSPSDVSQSSSNYYLNVKPLRSRPNKVPSGSSRAAPSLTAKDMYNFGSNSSLTYDSFWSSHSGSNTPRAVRGSIGVTSQEFAPTFQIPGDFTSGIQDHNRSIPASTFAPSSSSTAVSTYLELPRNPTGPT